MTTSETLYRAEELFQEKLKAKTNWGRNELIKEFQACIRQALGENLDEKEAKKSWYFHDDVDKGDIKPKGDGEVKLYGQPGSTVVSDQDGSHEIPKDLLDDDGNPF
jgi:hypothetical protein